MSLSQSQYNAAIATRRALKVADLPAALSKGMKSLTEVGWDGEYVVPNQITSKSFTGPVLLLDNWIGSETAKAWSRLKTSEVRKNGYDSNLTTNKRLDEALVRAKCSRSKIYITQACVLLPVHDDDGAPVSVYRKTFELITKMEIAGRRVIAAGSHGRDLCARDGTIEYRCCRHPSRESVETLKNLLIWATQ